MDGRLLKHHRLARSNNRLLIRYHDLDFNCQWRRHPSDRLLVLVRAIDGTGDLGNF